MKSSVKRRFVFYIAGFDPTGPAHYHRLYKEQAKRQASLLGYTVDVGDRKKIDDYLAQWDITHVPADDQSNEATHTEYVFARWDDIVRTHWGKMDSLATALQFIAQFFLTQWFYLRTGALWHMLRLAWPPVVALVSPLVLVSATFVLWLATPWMVANVLGKLSPSALWNQGALHTGLVIATWVLVSASLVWLVRKLENKFHMLWLMRSYLFTREQALGKVPAFNERVQVFAETIALARYSGKYDEVLVVGHSSGCILAVSSLAASLASGLTTDSFDDSRPVIPTVLGLVTLGHCIPMLSSLPIAENFRENLKSLSNEAALTWVDFSAPTDGCCFAFVDAVASAVPADERGVCAPKLLSPRLQTLFSPADYATLRRNRFNLHFQYIMAAPQVGEYDYFAITSGNISLADRFQSQSSVLDFTKFRLFG
jgi:hypothetical protein